MFLMFFLYLGQWGLFPILVLIGCSVSKNLQEVEVPKDDVHLALLKGFRTILRKAYPLYRFKLNRNIYRSYRGWTLTITNPRVVGDCIVYVDGDKPIRIYELADPNFLDLLLTDIIESI